MANTLTAVVGADTSGFTKSINEAKSVLQKYTQEAKNASQQIRENASISDSQVASYERVVKALGKVESGTLSTSQVQKALAAQLQELKIQWANLSDEAKSSDFGASLSSTLSSVESSLKELSGQVKQANVELGNIGGATKEIPLKKQLKQLQTQLVSLTAQYRAMSEAERQSANGQALAKKMDALREKAGALKDTIGDVSEEISVMASDTPNLDVFNDLIGIGGDALNTYSSILAKVTGDEESLKKAISTLMMVQSSSNLLTKVTNALQSSSAIMLKTRAIQEGAAAAAIRIRTLAEGKGTIATKAATVAQGLFNAVAKANPYVLLATAVIGVATALYAFASSSDKASEKERELQREAEATKKKMEEQKHAADTLGGKTGDLVGSFKVLQAQWKSLKTEAEKKEWIKNNQTAFDNLNLSVWNVNDAYEVFVKNAPKVIAALKAIAEAEAYQDLYKDAIKKKATEWDNRQQSRATGDYYTTAHKGDRSFTATGSTNSIPDEWKKAGIGNGKGTNYEWGQGQSGAGWWVLDEEGAKKLNEYRSKVAQTLNQTLQADYDATIQHYGELMDAANEKAQAAQALLGSMGGTGTKPTSHTHTTSTRNTTDKKGNPTENAVSGSLSDLEKQLADLQKKYKDGLIKITPEDYQKKVKELEDKIKKKKIELGLEVESPEGSIKKIDELIAKKRAELQLAIDDESRERIQKEIDELTGQKNTIELKLKPVIDEKDINGLVDDLGKHTEEVRIRTRQQAITPKGDKVEQATTNVSNLKEELDFNEALVKAYKEQYQAIQQKVQAGGILNANESQFVSIYDEARKKVDELRKSYDEASQSAEQLQTNANFNKKVYSGFKSTTSAVGGLNDAIKGIADSWQNLSDNWDDMDGLEKLTSSISALIGTIEKALSAYETINETIKIFGEISEAAAARKIASNTAQMASDEALVATSSANTATKLANDATENASEIGKIGVKEAGAIASATASGASLPFPANLAAIAAGIAAVVAAFSMISGFASGGIVGGNTTVGDYNLIRANKGEMILSNHQQANLFRLLNNGGAIAANGVTTSTIKIKGSDLYVALKNYSKMSPNKKL